MIEPRDGVEPCMRPVDWALRYAAAGLSVLPIACDGTKQPPAGQAWKHLQDRIANDDEISRMFAGDVGIAVINGKVSGNLETLDIDDPALVEPFEAAVREVAPELLDRLPTIATALAMMFKLAQSAYKKWRRLDEADNNTVFRRSRFFRPPHATIADLETMFSQNNQSRRSIHTGARPLPTRIF